MDELTSPTPRLMKSPHQNQHLGQNEGAPAHEVQNAVSQNVTGQNVTGQMESALGLRVREVISPVLYSLGYDLVRVMSLSGGKMTLQIMIERLDGHGIVITDCETASRTISALLDVHDLVSGRYLLEVSSPGLDRPLTRLKDFTNWSGFEARLELHEPFAGRKRFRGRLQGVSDAGTVRILLEEQTIEGQNDIEAGSQNKAESCADIPFESLAKAKLILNDELIAYGQALMKTQTSQIAETLENHVDKTNHCNKTGDNNE